VFDTCNVLMIAIYIYIYIYIYVLTCYLACCGYYGAWIKLNWIEYSVSMLNWICVNHMHVNQEIINLLSSLSSQAKWDFAVSGSSDVLLLLFVVGKGNQY
jgi:hypothetical protein